MNARKAAISLVAAVTLAASAGTCSSTSTGGSGTGR